MTAATLDRPTTPPPVIPPAALTPTGHADRESLDPMGQIMRAVTDRAYRRQITAEYRAAFGPEFAATFANAVRDMSREAGPAYHPIKRARALATMNRQNTRTLNTLGGGA